MSSPAAHRELPPAPARPTTVTAAFWCWIAAIVSAIVGLVLLLSSPIWTQAVEYAARTSPGEEIPALLNLFKIALVVAYLIGAGLYLFFAVRMVSGRNWARISLSVLGALGVGALLTPFSSSVTVDSQTYVGSQAPSYLTAALTLAGIVLMFVGGANQYFTAALAHRGEFR